jgi:hypothetical protein
MTTSKSELINNGFHGVLYKQNIVNNRYVKVYNPVSYSSAKNLFLGSSFTVLYRIYCIRRSPESERNHTSNHGIHTECMAIADGWWGWGEDAHPLSVQLLSRLQWTLQQRGQIHSTYFISTLYVLCVSNAPQSQIMVYTASMNFFMDYLIFILWQRAKLSYMYCICSMFNLRGGFYACLSDIFLSFLYFISPKSRTYI